jgi:hypothetical protein
LRTCLAQTSSDFEIVVADNASGPETRKAVEELDCSRIRYLRSDQALPMTTNWNRALEAAQGDWVVFIGDDDGLFPWSVAAMKELADRHEAPAVRWELAVYTWPCVAVDDQRHRLQLPLARSLERVDAHARIDAMLRNPQAAPIPLPYHGLIHRSLIDRALATGPLFDGPCPDTFAGVLLSHLAGEFLESSVPLTLVGVSGKSNGLQGVIEDGTGATYRDFVRLNEQAGIQFHAALPRFPTMAVIILDGLLRTRDRLKITDPAWQLTPAQVAGYCLDGLWQTGAVRDLLLQEILDRIQDPLTREQVQSDRRFARPSGKRPSAVLPMGVHPACVVLDAARVACDNIQAAAQFAGNVLGDPTHQIPWTMQVRPSAQESWQALRTRLSTHGYPSNNLKLPSQGWLARWGRKQWSSIRKRLPSIGSASIGSASAGSASTGSASTGSAASSQSLSQHGRKSA